MGLDEGGVPRLQTHLWEKAVCVVEAKWGSRLLSRL